MTQEEKQLFIVDICARLPYGVKIKTQYGYIITSDVNTFPIPFEEIDIEELNNIKPYLRPMSSMTEEEVKELSYNILQQPDLELVRSNNFDMNSKEAFRYIDWLNSHHFDYRGLIEKGLAIEAPKGMYEKEI